MVEVLGMLSKPGKRSMALVFVLLAACSDGGGSGDAGPDAGTDTDTDTDTDADSDSDTDTDTDTDTGTDSDTDSDSDTDTDPDAGPDTDTCSEIEGDAGASSDCVRYVDLDVAASGDGLSWATAFKTIQEAIDAAYEAAECGRCQIWITEGIYYIYEDEREDTVNVKPGIELYGGFAGTEASLDERDWEAHVTTLDGHASEGSVARVYHVVSTHAGNVVDGFRITGGLADAWTIDWGIDGAGLLNCGGDLTVKNCVVTGNDSEGSGGLFSYGGNVAIGNSSCGAVVANGVFVAENVTFQDDGLILGAVPSGTVSNCTFHSCGIAISESTIELTDIFITNEADHWCGISIVDGSTVDLDSSYIEGCTSDPGGGLSSENSIIHVTDTVFANNESAFGGGAYVSGITDPGDVTFTDCIFYGNRAGMASGALHGSGTVERCYFLNNQFGGVAGLGGQFAVHDSFFFVDGMIACDGSSVSQSIFASRNARATGDTIFSDVLFVGSGFHCAGESAPDESLTCSDWEDGQASLSNVTITGSSLYNAVSSMYGCDTALYGGIVWENPGGGMSGSATATYSVVQGGYAGEGNTSSDPLFAGNPVLTGTWSDVYFDEALFQTELTDETASWEPGELSGLIVNVNAGNYPTVIADNTGTTLWAWGNTTAYATIGDSYEILDLRLQPGSPAIDSGYGLNPTDFDVEGNARWDDPSATNAYDCGSEPDCFEYVDMGAYEYQP